MNKNIHTFIGCDSEYADSRIVLFGAPFDGTTSYRPGTRFAAAAMRSESFGIESYSPYQDKDLADQAIFDGGDLELGFGNPAKTLDIITAYTNQVLEDGKIPCMIGGEHLVTLGTLRAVTARYPDLHIIHFDAHADLREDYMGETLSHATVMRRAWELVGDGRLFQFGIRSGDKDEFAFAKAHTAMHKFDLEGLDQVIKTLQDKPVYLSIDLDVLDSSVFPGTGTPEAGGISFKELIAAILSMQELNIVACDLNELSPMLDASGASTAAACKALRELLLILA